MKGAENMRKIVDYNTDPEGLTYAVKQNDIDHESKPTDRLLDSILHERFRLGIYVYDDNYKPYTYSNVKDFERDVRIAEACISSLKKVPYDVEQRLIREKNHRDKIMEEHNKNNSQHK